jgi:CheY-like chemotaxis protein
MNMYKGQLRLLIVEDNTTDAELCLQELKSVGFTATADAVETPRAFAERLEEQPYDVILADYRIPGWSGIEALRQLKKTGKDIPFIVVTGALGDEAAVQCIKDGAGDYILKDRLARLPLAVFQLMEERRLRQASKVAEQTVARQAAELEQARERRFQMKGEFLDHVSHELRTPIAAACMFLTNTLDGLAGSLRPEQQDWLGKTLPTCVNFIAWSMNCWRSRSLAWWIMHSSRALFRWPIAPTRLALRFAKRRTRRTSN